MFLLKKFVSFWLMPVPFCLTLITVGWWLTQTPQRLRLGRRLVIAGAILLFVFGNRAVSTWLIQPIENTYPAIAEGSDSDLPQNLRSCRFVVVLGGGNSTTPGVSAINRLSNSSRSRLTEGLRILRKLPDARLVLSGGGEPGFPSHAEVAAQAAISLGVDPQRIIRFDSPRDTEEEALATKALVGAEPFALVTSAWHLPRAMSLLRKVGLTPVPCPADYLGRPPSQLTWTYFLWDVESLPRSTWAIYERLGATWSRLRGRAE
jgi:uncharacterized SAM-binding protein YcdF (DUF218 family)